MHKQQNIRRLNRLLKKTMTSDLYSLKKEYNRLFQLENPAENIIALQKKIESAITRKKKRIKNIPNISYNDDLPINTKRDEIIEIIKNNRVCIISGETGSGKTTQIPKFCIEAGRGINGKIGCTQPRRVAAVTVAERIAEELGEESGKSVGYKIRFKEKTNKNSYIKVMTDGILLAETQNDPFLNEYDTIIVDEAHERGLNIDFILGILKNLLKKRKDLNVIITSATIDTEKFSKAFDNAPVIEVSGRMFPVEVRYTDVSGLEGKNYPEKAVETVESILSENSSGDILIFMATGQDIRETCDLLEAVVGETAVILPLYAHLSYSEQKRVFTSHSKRKIITATNIAETSITIPGIKYVIDSGVARISHYSPRTGTTSLPVSPIARSSADQRMGRCGRVQNGVCIRLYEEEDYNLRPLFTPPEILRANLADVILRMISLRLGNITAFPFIDKPQLGNINDGINILLELEAIKEISGKDKSSIKEGTKRYSLTQKGKIMAQLPIDPRLSRMLIKADKENCLNAIIIISAALSIQDPTERPIDKENEADKKHAAYINPSSDFLTYLNIWEAYHTEESIVRSMGKMRKYCKNNFLSFKRMKEWRDIRTQIVLALKDNGFTNLKDKKRNIKEGETEITDPFYIAIHKSILSGFLSKIAMKKKKYIYRGKKDSEIMIFPGSGIFNSAGDWIIAADIVKTSKLFGRTAANIDQAWLEEAGGNLCKRTYKDPYWKKKGHEVAVTERVTLFGLAIVPGRECTYGDINPEEASDIFIKNALVQREIDLDYINRKFPFFLFNNSLITKITLMESKMRKRDLLINDNEIFRFYKERLKGIYNFKMLEDLLKKEKNDSFLRMSEKELLSYQPENEILSLYPDKINLGEKDFECLYTYTPGEKEDGVTVQIPSSIAGIIPPETLEWLVPGLYKEKLTALIKGLPKKFRKELVPISDTIKTILKEIPYDKNRKSGLIDTLGKFLYERYRIHIPAEVWPDESLPDHLKMRISIINEDGKEIRAGRDRMILKDKQIIKQKDFAMEKIKNKWEKEDITVWDFRIPGTEDYKLPLFPALTPESNKISLRLYENKDEAAEIHLQGIIKLYKIHFSKQIKNMNKELHIPDDLITPVQYFGGGKKMAANIWNKVIKDNFEVDIRTSEEFYKLADSKADLLFEAAENILNQSLLCINEYGNTRNILLSLGKKYKALKGTTSFLEKMFNRLETLLPENFISIYKSSDLNNITRYTKGIGIRSVKGCGNPEKDLVNSRQINPYIEIYTEFAKKITKNTSVEKIELIEDFKWLIEEFQISVYAQELGTKIKISPKRLDKKLGDIERLL